MIRYEPWSLRGYTGKVFQVYVELKDTHNLSELISTKTELNSITEKGLYIIENPSKAIKRLGWSYHDGFYYKLVE